MKVQKLIYFILALSVFFLLTSLFGLYLNNRVVQTEEFYASVNITERVLGFDLNGSALTFGLLAIGGSVERNIIFSNEHSFPVVAEIEVEGDIVGLLSFDRFVTIEEGEEERIPFTISAPRGSLEGFYDGNVKFLIRPA